MSARSFGSLFMVASCAGAALGCYLVSLRVASERASLEGVEAQIVSTQSDLRLLQTELGTRGRLSQLERWNAGAFELSAPSATQFVQSSFELAKLTRPEQEPDFHAPVVLASAPAPQSRQPLLGEAGAREPQPPTLASGALLHEASFKTEVREVPVEKAAVAAAPRPSVAKSANKAPAPTKLALAKPGPRLTTAKSVPTRASEAKAAKPAQKKSVDKPGLATVHAVTKHIEIAKTDPLAPLPDRHSRKDSPTGR